MLLASLKNVSVMRKSVSVCLEEKKRPSFVSEGHNLSVFCCSSAESCFVCADRTRYCCEGNSTKLRSSSSFFATRITRFWIDEFPLALLCISALWGSTVRCLLHFRTRAGRCVKVSG